MISYNSQNYITLIQILFRENEKKKTSSLLLFLLIQWKKKKFCYSSQLEVFYRLEDARYDENWLHPTITFLKKIYNFILNTVIQVSQVYLTNWLIIVTIIVQLENSQTHNNKFNCESSILFFFFDDQSLIVHAPNMQLDYIFQFSQIQKEITPMVW